MIIWKPPLSRVDTIIGQIKSGLQKPQKPKPIKIPGVTDTISRGSKKQT